MTTWIIVNPSAGSGRAEAVGRRLAAHLDGAEVMRTTTSGDATEISRRARIEGVDTVVAVGGDGTIQECVTGLVLDECGQVKSCATRLAICPAGTGGDFRKTFGWSESVDQCVARIHNPNPVAIDIGRATLSQGGAPRTTAFANVLSFGLGGLTDRLVSHGPKWLGGRAAFFWGAARANLIYQPLPVEIVLDGKPIEIAPFSNVAACSGRFFGGGMKIAPDANPFDGYLDVITMELSKLETFSLAADIYRGRHLRREKVKHYRCQRIEARTTRTGDCLIDVDGEQLGQLPLSIDVLPSAIHLLT